MLRTEPSYAEQKSCMGSGRAVQLHTSETGRPFDLPLLAKGRLHASERFRSPGSLSG